MLAFVVSAATDKERPLDQEPQPAPSNQLTDAETAKARKESPAANACPLKTPSRRRGRSWKRSGPGEENSRETIPPNSCSQ